MSELDQIAQGSQERDWWLERANSFIVDEYRHSPVIIREAFFEDCWVVEIGIKTLYQSRLSDGMFDKFSDRESALAAYLAWKQQQEGK